MKPYTYVGNMCIHHVKRIKIKNDDGGMTLRLELEDDAESAFEINVFSDDKDGVIPSEVVESFYN